MTKKLWLRAINTAATDAGIRHPILWLSHPCQAAAIGGVDESLSIYHIVDEYGGYTNQREQSRSALWQDEQAILQNVDMAITVSHQLVAAKSGNGADVHLVENAFDYSAFERWRSNALVPP